MNTCTRSLCLLVLSVLAGGLTSAQISVWRLRSPAAGLTVGINPINPNTMYAEGVLGHIIVSYDRGVTWSDLSVTPITQFREILVHPRDTATLFIAASGPGLYRTSDNGASWSAVINVFGIDGESVCYDPAHPDTMFAGNFSDGRVYRSLDRGVNWTQMGISGTNLCALAIRPDSANMICAGTGDGTISLSTNYGSSWVVVKQGTGGGAFQEVPKIAIHPVNPMIGYATSYGSNDSTLDVWKTTNGGRSWLRTGLLQTPTWAMEVDPINSEIVYAGTFDVATATVYKSTDGGTSWAPYSSGLPIGGSIWSLKVHPLDPSVIIASVTNGIFGYGGIYQWMNSIASVRGVLLDDVTGDTVKNGRLRNTSTGDLAAISASTPAFALGLFQGDTSSNPTIHIEAYPYEIADLPLVFTPDSNTTYDFRLQRLATASITGTLRDSITQLPVMSLVELSVSRSIGDTLLIDSTDAGGVFRFDNLYLSEAPVNRYRRLQIGPDVPYATEYIDSVNLPDSGLNVTFDLRHGDIFLIAAGDSGQFLRYYTEALDSLGLRSNRWDLLRRGIPPLSRAVEFIKRTVLYYTGNKSTPLSQGEHDSLIAALDAGSNVLLTGQNLAEQNASTALFTSRFGIGFGGNTGIAYCSGIAGDMFEGVTFFTQGSGANNQTSRDILVALDGRARPVLDYGLSTGIRAAFRVDSTGGAGKAVVMGFGLEAIHTVDKRRTVMQNVMNYFGGVTSVGENELHGGLPLTFRIDQNYPNPFNPVTVLRFEVGRFAPVTIKIFNLLGQEVATLLDESLQPGVYSRTWNAAGLSSGVYIFTLRAGSFSETKKLVLLR